MRVEFTGEVFQFQRVGGISRYVYELMMRLRRDHGVDVRMRLVLHRNEYLRSGSPQPQLRTRYAAWADDYWFPRLAPRLDHLCRNLRGAAAPLRHSSFFLPATLRNFSGVKICTFYDMIHERLEWSPRMIKRKRECFELSDHCIAISEATKRDMMRLYGCGPERITAIPLASEMNAVQPQRPMAVREGERYLLWVGNRGGYKNFDTFADALRLSSLRSRTDVSLVMTGSALNDGEVSRLREAGLDGDRVKVVAASDSQLAWLYRNAIALVYVSTLEGFGLPPLEAMSCGCPVIASDASCIPEVVGNAAYSVSPLDAGAIAQAVDELVESEARRAELVELGLRRAERFSWDRTARETLDVYRRLLGDEAA